MALKTIKLACIKHIFSVHSEPESNSKKNNVLYYKYKSKTFIVFKSKKTLPIGFIFKS